MPKLQAACDFCGEKYNYDESDIGQSFACDCGVVIQLKGPELPIAAPKPTPPAPSPPEASICPRCNGQYMENLFPEGCPDCSRPSCAKCGTKIKSTEMAWPRNGRQYCSLCYHILNQPPPAPRTEIEQQFGAPLTATECGNCGGQLGKLEPHYMAKGELVCWLCYQRLGPSLAPTKKIVKPPDYSGLSLVAGLLRVCGAVAILAAAISIIGAIAIAQTSPGEQAIRVALSGLGALIGGIIQIGIASALIALRDIAINSFHLRNRP